MKRSTAAVGAIVGAGVAVFAGAAAAGVTGVKVTPSVTAATLTGTNADRCSTLVSVMDDATGGGSYFDVQWVANVKFRFAFTGLQPSTTYDYTIESFDGSSGLCDQRVDSGSFTTAAPTPNVPH